MRQQRKPNEMNNSQEKTVIYKPALDSDMSVLDRMLLLFPKGSLSCNDASEYVIHTGEHKSSK